jgi:uncharacterized membrane protein
MVLKIIGYIVVSLLALAFIGWVLDSIGLLDFLKRRKDDSGYFKP